jgi:hypothetical protein
VIACETLADRLDYPLGQIERHGRDLGDADPAGRVVDHRRVGECSADIDTDPPCHREALTLQHRIMLASGAGIDQPRSVAWI